MKAEQAKQLSLTISQEQLLSFVRAVIGGRSGREDDAHPLPPGPWDPVIRLALQHINVFGPRPEPWRRVDRLNAFGPQPEPWRGVIDALEQIRIFGAHREAWASILARHPEIWDAIGGGHSFGAEVELNPQPLPPRFALMAAMAQVVISRAELMQEIADATRREGEERGIIIVGGYLARFADDYCGTDFRLKYPFPGPRPHWFTEELGGIDLVVMATQFEQAAKETFSRDLRQHLAEASAKLVAAGLSRLQ